MISPWRAPKRVSLVQLVIQDRKNSLFRTLPKLYQRSPQVMKNQSKAHAAKPCTARRRRKNTAFPNKTGSILLQ
jgi:hypothetical protein